MTVVDAQQRAWWTRRVKPSFFAAFCFSVTGVGFTHLTRERSQFFSRTPGVVCPRDLGTAAIAALSRWAHSLQLGSVLALRAQRPLGDLHVFATRKLELVLRAVHALHDTRGPI